MEGFVVGVLVAWLIFAAFGSWIATQKHRDGAEGFILGLMFGPLGVLVEAILPTKPAPPPPVVLTPEQAAAAEAEGRERQRRAWAEQQARVQALNEERRLAAVERWRWLGRMIFRFGWIKVLPDALQPVAWGLVIATPWAVLAAVVLRKLLP